MSEIRAANAAYATRTGRAYWFERGAMKFFNTRIEGGPYGGRLFVTSERFTNAHSTREESARHPTGWSVREAHPDGRISTVGNLQDYSSKAAAVAAAKRLAGTARANPRHKAGKSSRSNQGRRAARTNRSRSSSRSRGRR
jgi:hypothetical protein